MKLGAGSRKLAQRLILIGAWIVVVLTALGYHPALREGAPLAALGRDIADDAARGGVLLGAFGLSGSRVPLAFWALDLSLLYIALWGLFKLCPRVVDDSPGISLPLLIVALAGQAAACFAQTPTTLYFLSSGIASLALIPLWRQRAPSPSSPPSSRRLLFASLLGLVVVLLASPLDAGLASLTGESLLPEAWFPLAVEFGSRGGWPVGVALSVVVAGSCGALGLARTGWLGLVPPCVLILGPSNHAKGLAAAAVVTLLGRSGAGPLWRGGSLAVLVALFVMVSLTWK